MKFTTCRRCGAAFLCACLFAVPGVTAEGVAEHHHTEWLGARISAVPVEPQERKHVPEGDWNPTLLNGSPFAPTIITGGQLAEPRQRRTPGVVEYGGFIRFDLSRYPWPWLNSAPIDASERPHVPEREVTYSASRVLTYTTSNNAQRVEIMRMMATEAVGPTHLRDSAV